jgi:hypothetical protein
MTYECLCCMSRWGEGDVIYQNGIPLCPDCGSEDLTTIEEGQDAHDNQ